DQPRAEAVVLSQQRILQRGPRRDRIQSRVAQIGERATVSPRCDAPGHWVLEQREGDRRAVRQPERRCSYGAAQPAHSIQRRVAGRPPQKERRERGVEFLGSSLRTGPRGGGAEYVGVPRE